MLQVAASLRWTLQELRFLCVSFSFLHWRLQLASSHLSHRCWWRGKWFPASHLQTWSQDLLSAVLVLLPPVITKGLLSLPNSLQDVKCLSRVNQKHGGSIKQRIIRHIWTQLGALKPEPGDFPCFDDLMIRQSLPSFLHTNHVSTFDLFFFFISPGWTDVGNPLLIGLDWVMLSCGQSVQPTRLYSVSCLWAVPCGGLHAGMAHRRVMFHSTQHLLHRLVSMHLNRPP